LKWILVYFIEKKSDDEDDDDDITFGFEKVNLHSLAPFSFLVVISKQISLCFDQKNKQTNNVCFKI
jgi:hypothetical protein